MGGQDWKVGNCYFRSGLELMYRFIANLRGHVAAVYRVAWSADSRMLVSASKDTTLKVGRLFLETYR
jgi:WD40 repeat protein